MGLMRGSSGAVVVFDFDKTLLACDSDSWVIDGLGVTDTFERLRQELPWNALMDKLMHEIHSQGQTESHIADCLRGAPVDPHVVAAIKSAFALGCDLRIVSDANLFFITTILDHNGLLGCFTEIISNPTHIDGDGRLRIEPYHDFQKDPRGCPLCPANMCKGRVIERIQAEVGSDARFVYLGDGKGDFCPSLKLSEKDYVMPRKGYPLSELIRTRGGGGCGSGDEELVVRAEVHEWSSWNEQSETLLKLVHKALPSHDSTDSKVVAGGVQVPDAKKSWGAEP